jgi:hypothetical protein
MPTEITHAKLVHVAARWLRTYAKCKVVLTEYANKYPETPDALGWTAQETCILVECKVSATDFVADKQKAYRAIWSDGIGDQRYYLLTSALWQQLHLSSIPDSWGILVYIRPRIVVVCRSISPTTLPSYGLRAERSKLLSYVRRAQLRGFDGRRFPDEPVPVRIRRRRRRVRR